MNGACIYCGQVRIIDDKEIAGVEVNWLADETVKELEIQLADYVATKTCNCDKGKRFARKHDQYKAACDNVEYILTDAAGLFPLGKEAVKSVIEQNTEKVTISYGNTVVKISRGREEIKVEKTITTKESLES